ncbi:MAG: hypothetical protein PVG81_06650 [Desulfobacterales bacterium]
MISIPENVKDRRKNDRPAQQDAGCLRQNRLTDESEPVEKNCRGEYQRTGHDIAYSLGKMRVSFFNHNVSEDRAFPEKIYRYRIIFSYGTFYGFDILFTPDEGFP